MPSDSQLRKSSFLSWFSRRSSRTFQAFFIRSSCFTIRLDRSSDLDMRTAISRSWMMALMCRVV